MTITPYPHQTAMLDEARAALFEHNAVLLQSPTGSGKTAMGTLISQGAASKGRRVMFTCHRDFLVDQTSASFDMVDMPHGIIAAGFTPNPRELVQVAAIDTLKNRLEKVRRPDVLIVDECHHSVAAGWAKVIKLYKDAGTKIIGLSATPIRLDGRGLGEFYSYMVKGPSVRSLIDGGFLSDYEAYAPTLVNLAGVHSRMGDYIRSEAEEVMDKPTITGDAIREYSRLAPGKRAVAFCISVVHSQHVCAQFNASGIPAAHIDGTTPKGERKRLLEMFRRGEVRVLTSVDIFGEGFDLPSVEVAILLRPTQSLSLHLQQIGRALRTAPGKEKAVILDHCGNLMKLGLPDTDFDWTLEGREKKKGKKSEADLPVRQCESCFAVFAPAPFCPVCGAEQKSNAREIKQVEGELQKLTPEMIAAARQAKRVEVGRAKSIEELEQIERERGYKPGWARHTWEARQGQAQARAEAQARAYGGGRWFGS